MEEEYEVSPDWCMITKISNRKDEDIDLLLNVNTANRNRSPDKHSSSSIEVIYEDEETLNDASKTSENLEEIISEIQNIEDNEHETERESQSFVEYVSENNSGNQDNADLETIFPQLFTENSATTQLIETLRSETRMRNSKKVIKRKATDSGNHKVKKIRMKSVDKLISHYLEDVLTLCAVLAAILYLVTFFSNGVPKSNIKDTIAELKEENRLIKEELSNYIKNENATKLLLMRKFAEILQERFPERKEFDDLKEQVKVLSDSKKLKEEILEESKTENYSSSKASLVDVALLSAHLEKFNAMISALYAEMYPENNNLQENNKKEENYKLQENNKIEENDKLQENNKIEENYKLNENKKIEETYVNEDHPCSIFFPSNSEIVPDETKSLKSILEYLQNEDFTVVISTQISALKSFGYRSLTFMKKFFQCIDRALHSKHPVTEMKKAIKNFDDLMVKWKESQLFGIKIKDKKTV